MKKTKLFAFLLAVLMGLTACGKRPTLQKSTDISGDAYVYDTPLKITAFSLNQEDVYYGGETIKENAWVDLYKEYNIEVDFKKATATKTEIEKHQEDVKANQATTTLDLESIFTSFFSALPEIVTLNKEMLLQNKMGIATDMTQLLEEYATAELMEYLYSDGGLAIQGGMIDGKIYALPMIADTYTKPMVMCIRKDWLDNLGLEVPTTMEELAEVAYAFTHNDPDKNGKKDTYGLSISGKNIFNSEYSLSAVFQAFGCVPAFAGENYTFLEKDGQLIWGGSLSQEMKEALYWIKDLYDKGCIPELFQGMSPYRVEMFLKDGNTGIYFGNKDGYIDVLTGLIYRNNAEAEVIAVPMPSTGKNITYIPEQNTVYYGVTNKCKNPEVLIQLMNIAVDKLITPENREEYDIYMGDQENFTGYICSATPLAPVDMAYDCYLALKKAFKAESIDVLEEEIINYKMKVELYEKMMKLENKEFGQGNDYADAKCTYFMCSPDNSYFSAVEKMIEDECLVNCAYNGTYTKAMTENQNALYNLLNDTVTSIIIGKESIDYYDVFLEEWEKLGGVEVMLDARAWYEANKCAE